MQTFTVGYTQKSAQQFFELTKANQIDVLIDVRLYNSTQLAGFSKSRDLQYFLKEICGCDYVSPASGSLNGSFTITAARNATSAIRSGQVVIEGGGVERTIDVTQADEFSGLFSRASHVYNHQLARFAFDLSVGTYFPMTRFLDAVSPPLAEWVFQLLAPTARPVRSILEANGFRRNDIEFSPEEPSRSSLTNILLEENDNVDTDDFRDDIWIYRDDLVPNYRTMAWEIAEFDSLEENNYVNTYDLGHDRWFSWDALGSDNRSVLEVANNVDTYDFGLYYRANSGTLILDYRGTVNELSSGPSRPHETILHAIAHRQIAINGQERPLVIVSVRGSVSGDDWLSNFAFWVNDAREHVGFATATAEVLRNLRRYVSSNDLNNPIFLVTGHSRGAAVANLLAAHLNAHLLSCTNAQCRGCGTNNQSNVFSYTFATPHVQRGVRTNHRNIFNILNRCDPVTKIVAFTNASLVLEPWGRHGIDIPISMDWVVVDPSHHLGPYYNFMRAHNNLTYNQIRAISNMGWRARRIRLKCPVDITLYNTSDEAIAQIMNDEVIPIEGSEIFAWVTEDGEKNFFIPYGADVSHARVVARDYGEMQFAVATLDDSSAPHELNAFENIRLYPGRTFMTDLTVDMVDTQVFIMQDGEIIGEVAQCGTEIILGEGETVNTWAELRDAVNAAPAGEPTVIFIASNMNPETTITIPANRQIILVSDDGERVISQTRGQRHFIAEGNLMLCNGITLNGGGVEVRAGGQLTMTSGSAIEHAQRSDAGGAVALIGGEFHMLGGTIRNNTASSTDGAVSVAAGTFNRVGGTITGNTPNN